MNKLIIEVLLVIVLLSTPAISQDTSNIRQKFLDHFSSDNSVASSNQQERCWQQSYGRGVGVPISSCPEGKEDDAGLCYPYCQNNYTGVGPVCWQNCPAGFQDDGAFCEKPAPYGRGAGWISQSECEQKEQTQCEENGLLWYPVCREGFHAAGCCVCSPNCVDGMIDIGVSCEKQSYGRGVGTPLTCAPGFQYDAGLCYHYCKAGFYGVGPVCWQTCPRSEDECGALCLPDNDSCADTVKQDITDTLQLALAAAAAVATDGADLSVVFADALQVIGDFAYDICPSS